MKPSAISANTILLLWMAAGCIAVAVARDEDSSLKKLLRDFNAPALSLVSDFCQGIEEHEWTSFLIVQTASKSRSDLGKNSESQPDSAKADRLQREVFALQELLKRRKRQDEVFQSSSRLFGPKLIAAQILLADQQQRWKAKSLLSAGKTKKIREQDWIISGELPLIDLGKDFGVKPDEILLAGRVVVGQIDAVGRWTSSYRSVTDPKFRCPATVVKTGTSKLATQVVQAVGSFHGTDAEYCELHYIENTYPVRVGDLVVLADEDQRFQGSLVLGTVTEARVLPNSPFWKIQVRPIKTSQHSRDVFVISEELNPVRLLTN